MYVKALTVLSDGNEGNEFCDMTGMATSLPPRAADSNRSGVRKPRNR